MNFFSSLSEGGNSTNIQDVIINGAFFVDVREPMEFESGSAKGAINIPLGTIPENLNQFKDKQNIVVFCRSGARSAQAKAFLDANGISNVYNGGAWQNVAMMQQ